MKILLCVLLSLALLLPAAASDQPKYIALSFDDGPSGHYTSDLLDGLAEREVKASFFLCGYRVEQFPTLTKRIADEGHEIGTHGDTHRFFSELSPTEVCEDLQASVSKLEAVTGKRPKLLRPPGGIYDTKILRQTTCADLPIILWSVDPDDWCCSSSETIASHVVKNAKSGDIVLLHDMSESSVKAAFKIIDRLEAKGFEFVTVSELAKLSGTVLQGTKAYSCFRLPQNASMSSLEAQTEPCTKKGFPPPRPFNSALSLRTSSRKSPFLHPKA